MMMAPGLGDWSQTFQSMLESWSKAGQQILLNLNQPKLVETNAAGTTVYATGPGTPGAVAPVQPSTVEGTARGISSSLVLLILGGAVLYMVLRKGDD